MMSESSIGGMVGVVLGVLGGAIGLTASLIRTKSSRQRARLLRWVGVFIVGITAFFLALNYTPMAFRFYLWIIYFPALVFWIVRANRIDSDLPP